MTLIPTQRLHTSLWFGKIFCVSLGYVRILSTSETIKGDEKKLLKPCLNDRCFSSSWGTIHLCGHSVRVLSFHILCRAIINDVSVHYLFGASGLKPWDTWMCDIKGVARYKCESTSFIILLTHLI